MNKKMMAGIFAGLLITSLSTGFAATSDPFADEAYIPVDRNWKAFENQTKVKGIYVTGNAIGYNKKFDQLLDLAVTTEINAMIIDVNNDSGHFTYPTQVPMAVAEGLNNAPLSPKFSVKLGSAESREYLYRGHGWLPLKIPAWRKLIRNWPFNMQTEAYGGTRTATHG